MDKRMSDAKKIAVKLPAITKAGASKRTLARAGVTAKQVWSAEQQGVSDSVLHKMRVTSAYATLPDTRGGCIDMLLFVIDGRRSGIV